MTALYRQIYEAAGDIKPKNISVDTLSRAFAGNEIDRVQVYGFAMHMQKLAMVAEGSVTVLSQPSLAGISSGSGISGSTAWHGAFRFRQYLKGVKATDGEQPESDLRELEFKKNQYGPLGESVVLRYQGGLFLPEAGVSSLDKAVRTAKANELFLDLLRRFASQGAQCQRQGDLSDLRADSIRKGRRGQKMQVQEIRARTGHARPFQGRQDRCGGIRKTLSTILASHREAVPMNRHERRRKAAMERENRFVNEYVHQLTEVGPEVLGRPGVSHMVFYHDNGCRIYGGSACSREPEVRFFAEPARS